MFYGDFVETFNCPNLRKDLIVQERLMTLKVHVTFFSFPLVMNNKPRTDALIETFNSSMAILENLIVLIC